MVARSVGNPLRPGDKPITRLAEMDVLGSQADNRALLPTGLHDVLAPDAAHEADVIQRLVDTFAQFGYERVKPPLVEFETTLLGGDQTGLADHIFRVMDPVSQRMMGLRADMTLQIARIAATRLARAPRPLRLSYAGQVLRVSGTQLRPERQFTQAGVELIGVASVGGDVEMVQLAVSALRHIGITKATVDLTSPAIVTSVLGTLDLPDDTRAHLRAALDRKDAGAVSQLAGADANPLHALIAAAGPAEGAFEKLKAIDLPAAARAEIARLHTVVDTLQTIDPAQRITIDAVEYRGFEYQTGISFTLFAQGVRGELGRGGRYIATAGEPATGLTLFLDSVMRAVPPPQPAQRLFLPFGTPPAVAMAMHNKDWVTVAGLEPAATAAEEARRHACSHIYRNGAPEAL